MSDAVLTGPINDHTPRIVLSVISLAGIALVSAIMGHLLSPLLGVSISVLFGLLIGTSLSAFAAPSVLIFFLFQNLLISIVSPSIDSESALTMMRSTNFVLTFSVWAAMVFSYCIGRDHYPGMSRQFNAIALVMVIVVLYFVVGYLRYKEASIFYFRNIFTPLMFLQIALISFQKFRLQFKDIISALLVIILAFGYLEFSFGETFSEAFNQNVYSRISSLRSYVYPLGPWVEEMEQSGHVTRDFYASKKVFLFNFALFSEFGKTILRPGGPNLHSISFAYVLAVFSLILFAMGRRLFVIASFPMLLLIGSKGAMIFFLLSLAGLIAVSFSRSWKILYCYIGLLATYATVALLTAIAVKNYHALGLIAGLKGFPLNPIGHGLGSSGILAIEFTDINWDAAQHTGSTDVVVESAIAVLLNQMGAATFAIIGLNIWLAVQAWRRFQESGDKALAAAAFMLLSITVNGVFHEEAMFAPLAQGTVMIMVGFALGRYNSTVHSKFLQNGR